MIFITKYIAKTRLINLNTRIMAIKKKIVEQATQYIESVRAAITKDYGFVPPEWEMQLTQLFDMYKLYLHASKSMETEEPIVMINAGKTSALNQNIKLMHDSIATCDKIVKSFGLSPLAKSKIGKNVAESADDDYFNTL